MELKPLGGKHNGGETCTGAMLVGPNVDEIMAGGKDAHLWFACTYKLLVGSLAPHCEVLCASQWLQP